jgi:hypothetical protein
MQHHGHFADLLESHTCAYPTCQGSFGASRLKEASMTHAARLLLRVVERRLSRAGSLNATWHAGIHGVK